MMFGTPYTDGGKDDNIIGNGIIKLFAKVLRNYFVSGEWQVRAMLFYGGYG